MAALSLDHNAGSPPLSRLIIPMTGWSFVAFQAATKDFMRRYGTGRLGGSQVEPLEYGVYMWDAAADVFRMDATLCRYLGIPEAAGVDGISLHRVISLIHSADSAEFSSAIKSSARTGSSFRRSFRLWAAGNRAEKLQAIGQSFLGSDRTPGLCTGIVFRSARGMKSAEVELADHCIAAYELARGSKSPMVQYLISMALIELGYQIAGLEPGKIQ
jgi:hypothetical protein